MAPEQALDAKTADKRSDVFGMGATIYALLAGRPPFKGDVVMKVLMATMHEPHPPIKEFRPDISQALSDVIDRCLDKHPENRFADARQLIRALKNARKVVQPDSTFGGEDEGGAEENDEDAARLSSPQAPRIGDPTRFTPNKIPAVPEKSNKTLMYGGIAAAVVVVAGLAFVFGRGGGGGGTKPVDDPANKKPIVEEVKPLPEGTKKLVLDAHGNALQGVYDALTVKNFEAAEFKYNSGQTADQQFQKQLPSLGTDWDKARKDIDAAKKGGSVRQHHHRDQFGVEEQQH